jgi:hypothetical protein
MGLWLRLGSKPFRHHCEESPQDATEPGTGILARSFLEAISFMAKI